MLTVENGWPIDPRFAPGKLWLFIDEEAQRLIDSFAYCFKIKITIFSARMEEMIVGLKNPGSAYCRLIQNKLRLRYRCCHQDKLACERCEQHDKTIVYSCYAGLTEIVTPIKIDGKLIGYGFAGQFITDYKLPEEIEQLWVEGGFDVKDLRDTYKAGPFFEKPALDNMCKLFSMMLDFIVTRRYVGIRHPDVVERVMDYLDEHIAEPLSLGDIAAALKCSRSTISHKVKRKLGMNFKKLYIFKKVQHFESIIAANPELQIQEAAALVGYEDPFYFSRLYKKIRLACPSSYVDSVLRKQDHVKNNSQEPLRRHQAAGE